MNLEKGRAFPTKRNLIAVDRFFKGCVLLLEPAGVWGAQAELVEPLKENHHVVKRFRFHSTFEAPGACGHNYLATNASDIRQQEHEPDYG